MSDPLCYRHSSLKANTLPPALGENKAGHLPQVPVAARILLRLLQKAGRGESPEEAPHGRCAIQRVSTH